AHLRFRRYLHHRYLPPFPTRRSSDLDPDVAGGQPVHPVAGLPVGRGGAAAGECADAVTRQLREKVRQVGARGVPVQSEAALGERSEEHTSELQSRENLVCRLLLEKKK